MSEENKETRPGPISKEGRFAALKAFNACRTSHMPEASSETAGSDKLDECREELWISLGELAAAFTEAMTPAPVEWSKDPPTEPGPYWVRSARPDGSLGEPYLVELFDRGLAGEEWTSEFPRWIVHYFGVSATDVATRFVWGPKIEAPPVPKENL